MQASTEMKTRALPIAASFLLLNKIDLDQSEGTAGWCKVLLWDASFLFVPEIWAQQGHCQCFSSSTAQLNKS